MSMSTIQKIALQVRRLFRAVGRAGRAPIHQVQLHALTAAEVVDYRTEGHVQRAVERRAGRAEQRPRVALPEGRRPLDASTQESGDESLQSKTRRSHRGGKCRMK